MVRIGVVASCAGWAATAAPCSRIKWHAKPRDQHEIPTNRRPESFVRPGIAATAWCQASSAAAGWLSPAVGAVSPCSTSRLALISAAIPDAPARWPIWTVPEAIASGARRWPEACKAASVSSSEPDGSSCSSVSNSATLISDGTMPDINVDRSTASRSASACDGWWATPIPRKIA